MKRIPLLLHGHVHMSESKASHRPVVRGEAYPVPAPTLCSIPTAGSGRGMNIHFISGKSADKRIMDTVVWYFSESMAFNPANALRRYRFVLHNDDIDVEHVD